MEPVIQRASNLLSLLAQNGVNEYEILSSRHEGLSFWVEFKKDSSTISSSNESSAPMSVCESSLSTVFSEEQAISQDQQIFESRKRPRSDSIELDLHLNSSQLKKGHFFALCENGDTETVALLLSEGMDIDMIDEDGRTMLIVASSSSQVEICKLLVAHGANIDHSDKFGQSALHIACKNGNLPIACLLLENGAQKNLKDFEHRTPLHFASKKGHMAVVELLLSHGEDLDIQDSSGRTALFVACANGHSSAVSLILSHKPNFKRDNKGSTPLHVACGGSFWSQRAVEKLNVHDGEFYAKSLFKGCPGGFVDIVNLLISAGVDLDAWNTDGQTALHVACWSENREIVDILLAAGSKIDQRSNSGQTPFYVACGVENVEIARLLLQKGADVNLCDKLDLSALHISCIRQNGSLVKLLCDHDGADKYQQTKLGSSSLHLACSLLDPEVVSILLSAGLDPNLPNRKGQAPLHIVCSVGDRPSADQFASQTKIINLLLSSGANLNQPDINGATVLHTACAGSHFDLAKFLLDLGANKDGQDELGRSPLFVACLNGDVQIVKLLLSVGANKDMATSVGGVPVKINTGLICPNVDDTASMSADSADSGYTPLHASCTLGRTDLTKLILSSGANKDCQTFFGYSPLHTACVHKHPDIVNLLLHAGVNVNVRDYRGHTPLLKATMAGQTTTVELLLAAGADLNIGTNRGAIPLALACERGFSQIVSILLSHGANPNAPKNRSLVPLCLACANGHFAVVALLLHNKADKQVLDDKSRFPLFLATSISHFQIVKLLLANGVNVHQTDSHGWTALHVACRQGHFEITQLLLSAGARIDLQNKGGLTPFDLASVNKHFRIVTLLNFLNGGGADVSVGPKEEIPSMPSALSLEAPDVTFVGTSAPELKVAIIVANSDYSTDPLPDCMVEAKSMKTCLEQLGFSVKVVSNVTANQMKSVVDEFAQDLLPMACCLFYYAGHGTKSASGGSLLIGIDGQAVSFETLMGLLLATQKKELPGLLIGITDCCSTVGSQDVEIPCHTIFPPHASRIFLHASDFGQAALADDHGGHFTSVLIKKLQKYGTGSSKGKYTIDHIFSRVLANLQHQSGHMDKNFCGKVFVV